MHYSKTASLFDHLIGGGEQRRRHSKAEHPGGRGVDDQLEFRRLQHRQIGRFRALEDAAGIDADLAKRIAQTCAVAHQPADFGKLTVVLDCRNRVACRQLGQLDTPVGQEGGGANEEGVGSLACKRRERGIDLAAVAGVEDLDLQPLGAGSRFHASHCSLGIGSIGRIDEHGNTNGPGHQLAQEFQPLCSQFSSEKIDTRQVAARPGEAGDKTKPDRVFGEGEDDRDRRSCRFGGSMDGIPPLAAITATRRCTNSAASAGSRSI